MATRVNLDAMIKRADFAVTAEHDSVYENVQSISLRDFTEGGMIGPNLRKPDFQRETNHWTPNQVVSLLECFTSGDLIPSVILWQAPAHLFVIDGGHRLSVLRSWIEDDYGDGPVSLAYFGSEISADQKKAANRTRKLIKENIGSWQHFKKRLEDESIDNGEKRRITAVISRALPIQWVKGDADKAEGSFFRINTKGTPLDAIEELLLRSRKRPISIAARAVIRAGKGHKYWSSFGDVIGEQIEDTARELHTVLFEPELSRPIKTLDLPLGGSKGVRNAIKLLIDFMVTANRDQQGNPRDVYGHDEDSDGSATTEVLRRSIRLATRITGNSGGSLGLHPAVYFYGPSGRHSSAMFMGTVRLLGRKMANNDPSFFRDFTDVREETERILIEHKDLIATILQKHMSTKREGVYCELLQSIVDALLRGESVSEKFLVDSSGLTGKLIVGAMDSPTGSFTDETKSAVFINDALAAALKCPICKGYLDPEKSVSYDHVLRRQDGGNGAVANCQLTHPFCNQSIKN